MDINILQWIGYVASGLIALSMTMNSIVKFRWINLAGAGIFATYGLLFGAYPVFLLNSFIVLVDIFYLRRIYGKKQLFDILEIKGESVYLQKFLDFHQNEILSFFPGFDFSSQAHSIKFFVLRNMAVAGVFLAEKDDDRTLRVDLDYVIPEYRDYKNGKYVYHRIGKYLVKNGFNRVVAKGCSKAYNKYLIRMGFSMNTEGLFVKELEPSKNI